MKIPAVEKTYLICAAALFLAAGCIIFNGKQGSLFELYDFGEHVASIRELSENIVAPGNPLIADEKPTLRYTPYIFLLAVVVKCTPITVLWVVKLAALVNVLVFLSGIYLWAKTYFDDEHMPVYVLITFLFLWGKPFGYSNEYSLRFLSYTAFYPSITAFSLGFFGLFALQRAMSCTKKRYYGGYLLLTVFVFLTHPLTASFYLLCSFFIILSRSTARVLHLGLYFSGCAAAVIIACVWPYYPFGDALLKSTTTPWYDFKGYLYELKNIIRIGPAFLGVPVILFFLVKRRYFFIVCGFAVSVLIYAVGGLLDIYLLDRYVFFCVFFMHLGLAWLLRRLGLLSVSEIRSTIAKGPAGTAATVALGIVVLGSICYQAAKVGCEQAGYEINFTRRPMVHRYNDPLPQYRRLAGVLEAGNIVLSDPLTSWLIPAFTGAKIVALYHNNPMVADNDVRRRDSRRFYQLDTALPERRHILQKHSVTHVLINRYRMQDSYVNRVRDYYVHYTVSEGLINDMKALGSVVFENGDMVLFALNR